MSNYSKLVQAKNKLYEALSEIESVVGPQQAGKIVSQAMATMGILHHVIDNPILKETSSKLQRIGERGVHESSKK